MIFWLDAQLPPGLAAWLSLDFHVEALALVELGLRNADDASIFERARSADIVLVTGHGPEPVRPPIWLVMAWPGLELASFFADSQLPRILAFWVANSSGVRMPAFCSSASFCRRAMLSSVKPVLAGAEAAGAA